MKTAYEPTNEIRELFLHFFRLKVDGHYEDERTGLTDEVYTKCVDAFHEIANAIESVIPSITEYSEDDEMWYDDFMDDILPEFYDIIFNRGNKSTKKKIL